MRYDDGGSRPPLCVALRSSTYENLLRATMLKSMNELCRVFANNPHDPDDLLVGLVLSVHDFDEENNCGKLHVCKGSHKHCQTKTIPRQSWANGFRVGDMPQKFDGAKAIERAAVYAVHVKGHVVALESRKSRSIPG